MTCIATRKTWLYLQFDSFQNYLQRVAEDRENVYMLVVSRIRQMADELDKFQFDTNIATTVGSSVVITGAAITVVSLSLALAPVTAGASVALGLTIGGGVAGGAGAATSIGSVITRLMANRKRMKVLKKILKKDKRELTQMETMAEVLLDMYNSCMDAYDSTLCSNLYRISHISGEVLQRVVNDLDEVQTQLYDLHKSTWPDDEKREMNILIHEGIERAKNIVRLLKRIKQNISALGNSSKKSNDDDYVGLTKDSIRGTGHNNQLVRNKDVDAEWNHEEDDVEDGASEKYNMDTRRAIGLVTTKLAAKTLWAGLEVRAALLKEVVY